MGQKTGSVHGLPVRGQIESVDARKGIAKVRLPLKESNRLHNIKLPLSWYGPKGQVSGGYPDKGTSIFVIQGQGNEWIFLGYDSQNSVNDSHDNDGTNIVNSLSRLKPGTWISLVENDIGIINSPKDGVTIGDSTEFVHIDPVKNIYSSKTTGSMSFTDSNRSIVGPLKRDLQPNSSRGTSGSALFGHPYETSLWTVGLDPKGKASISSSSTRNPALVESRSMYYEFANSYAFTNDRDESRRYEGEDPPKTKPFQRKNTRTDTMSLSLDHPNYLAETILGTVVDIYGNILDINRSILPSGQIESLSFEKSEDDKSQVFTKLREQLRKSIAYHFELNARKDGLEDALIDYNDREDYARQRSRFHLDIDKEGQFKLNVPSSSEVGNVPLLVRHENFSNIVGFQNEEDRGKFLRNLNDKTDIQLEPHGVGFVDLTSNEEALKTFAAPLDNFFGQPIQLGTGYHNIGEVLAAHKYEEILSGTGGFPNSPINQMSPVEDVVSSEVIVSGEGANAGGRSGTISLDGFLSLSVGANTVDRQSMWVDCAGGIVAAIGRDRFNRSVSASFDGDLFMEVGGPGIVDDSRFQPSTGYSNDTRDGIIDIRIWRSGSFHIIRVDNTGMYLHSPGNIDIVSEKNIRLKALGDLNLDAQGSIYMYPSLGSPIGESVGAGRYILKTPFKTIG